MDNTNTFLNNIFAKRNLPTPDSTSKINYRNIFLVGFIFFGILAISVLVWLITSVASLRYSTLNLIYTPASSVAKIDGVEVDPGELRLSPGNHEITIEKPGFETVSKQLNLAAGSETPLYVSLESNEPYTENWYSYHPNDQKIGEEIGSLQFDNFSEKLNELYPFVKNLPIKTANFEIYRGSCEGEVCFVIYASDEYKNAAINYFKSNLNKNIGNYIIRFNNYSNPFKGEG